MDFRERTKLKIAISKLKNKENAMRKNNIYKIATVACCMFAFTGVAFATQSVIEKIWKEPETYNYSYELTEQDKQNAISENDAKNKATEYLRKIGLEDEVRGLYLRKNAYKGEVVWDIGFGKGTIRINSKGEFDSLNIPSCNYTIPYDYGITREEARKVAKELLVKYNPNNNSDEYELVSLKRNSENDEDAYIWYAEFYKKYDGLFNKYENICIGWIPTINGLYSLSFENYKYENNEQLISKDDAIRTATEKDKKIETRHNIISTEAELGIDKMNTEVVYREKDIENYEKGTINFTQGEDGEVQIKEDAVFYKVDNRVRKVWEVTIYYDYYKYDKNFPERFVYYVDATTGEIIGGSRYYGTNVQLEKLVADPHNVIEK